MQIRVLTAGLLAASVTGGVVNTCTDQHTLEFPVGWSWYLARSRISLCFCESLCERPGFLWTLSREFGCLAAGLCFPALQLRMEMLVLVNLCGFSLN